MTLAVVALLVVRHQIERVAVLRRRSGRGLTGAAQVRVWRCRIHTRVAAQGGGAG